MNRPVCTGTRKDGQPCRAPALPDSMLCWSHDPRQAEVAAQARAAGASKGGKLRSLHGHRSRLSTVPELVRFVATLVHRTIEGELDVNVARCVFYGLSLQKNLVELSDLERRLGALEAAAAEVASKKAGRGWSA